MPQMVLIFTRGEDMILTEITMKDFKKGLKTTKTLIVPYGTVEAHGTHLPLSTDTLIIYEAVKRAASRTPVFVAPPLHYGTCTSTGAHPGTVGITPETLRRTTSDIVRDGHRKGLRNFILISGHGGGIHVSAIKEAGEELTRELKGVKIAALSIYDILGPEAMELAETTNDSHAGELETSLILHLAPGLVKGRAKEEYPGLPKPIIARDKPKYWPGAVWGNPKKATTEKGKRLFNMMVERIEELVKRIEKVKV
jgi:creatinine amidohydrolase